MVIFGEDKHGGLRCAPTGQTELFAAAKANLVLNILGTDSNGYHLLDMVMVPTQCYDRICFCFRTDQQVTVQYTNGAQYQTDYVERAVRFFVERYGTVGADIVVTNHIPSGAGVGGSSAVAARVVKHYEDTFSLAVPNGELLALGSDVPAMRYETPCRVQGVGERVERVALPKLFGVVLVDSRLSVNTKEAYALYDRVGGAQGDVDAFLKTADTPFNSLENAAVCLAPSIAALKEELFAAGFLQVVLTGSGSGVAAYTKDKALYQRACQKLERATKGSGNRLLLPFCT